MELELTTDGKHYTDGKQLYQRVTTYLKERLLPHFDAEAKAKEMSGKGKYALYGYQEILDEWARNGKAATDRGTEVHNFIQAYLTEDIPAYTMPEAFTSNLVSFLDAMQLNAIKRGYSLHCEQALKSDELLLAGTTDLFLFDGSTLVVRDWKTNQHKPIHDAPTYNKFMHHPYHFPLNDYAKHTAQLNIYARMIIEQGICPQKVDLGVYWIDNSGKVELIKSPYLPDRTAALLPAKIISN